MGVRFAKACYPKRSMLILASASPRRHELLLAAGIQHRVQPSFIPEERFPNETPAAFVQRIAEAKARAITCEPDDVVLAADTAVVLEDHVLGKPNGPSEARRMLHLLCGRKHWVYTGICILSQQRVIVDLAITTVHFLPLSDEEIDRYIQSEEPFDKAGGYAIQGLGSKFVSSIEGNYQNVVGLPVSLVYSYLK